MAYATTLVLLFYLLYILSLVELCQEVDDNSFEAVMYSTIPFSVSNFWLLTIRQLLARDFRFP